MDSQAIDVETGPVLVVCAHPDDADFFFGATIAALTSAGADVYYVICTGGSLGDDERGASEADLAATRHAEQIAAAAVLGVRDVTFLGFRDGTVTVTPVLRQVLAREIRRRTPRLMLTHFPSRVLEVPIEASHPDHVAVGEAAMSAAYPDAVNPRAHPELIGDGFLPHRVTEIWLPGFDRPNHWIDATPFLDKKIAAIRCHRSQLSEEERETGPEWVYEWMRQVGAMRGYEYAEHFKRVRL